MRVFSASARYIHGVTVFLTLFGLPELLFSLAICFARPSIPVSPWLLLQFNVLADDAVFLILACLLLRRQMGPSTPCHSDGV